MADKEIRENQSEVLEEFEVDGRTARILRLKIEDMSERDRHEHAENLANTNFKLLQEVPHAETRALLRGKLFKAREKLKSFPFMPDKIGNSKAIDSLMHTIYPDHAREEHVSAYENYSFQKYADKGQLLGVELDGRIVAVQAFDTLGNAESGRPVFEFTKASTLNDPRYRGKKLNPKLKKLIFDGVMEENPDAMWVSCSANQEHLKRFAKKGWHIVEIDDPNEGVQVMLKQNPDYLKVMKKQGYKAVYLDPQEQKYDN